MQHLSDYWYSLSLYNTQEDCDKVSHNLIKTTQELTTVPECRSLPLFAVDNISIRFSICCFKTLLQK